MLATITQTRRFVLSCLLAIVTSGFTAAVASAEECSDFTTNNRPCTASEELGYCFDNARISYEECLDSGGFVWDVVVCGGAADIDILGCIASLPFTVV
jgi:hypothetical protein